jgi:hypothetical protein
MQLPMQSEVMIILKRLQLQISSQAFRSPVDVSPVLFFFAPHLWSKKILFTGIALITFTTIAVASF